MSLKYVRENYRVPAKRGVRIMFRGQEYKITSAKGPYLRVRGSEGIITIHPTWCVHYF